MYPTNCQSFFTAESSNSPFLTLATTCTLQTPVPVLEACLGTPAPGLAWGREEGGTSRIWQSVPVVPATQEAETKKGPDESSSAC